MRLIEPRRALNGDTTGDWGAASATAAGWAGAWAGCVGATARKSSELVISGTDENDDDLLRPASSPATGSSTATTAGAALASPPLSPPNTSGAGWGGVAEFERRRVASPSLRKAMHFSDAANCLIAQGRPTTG